MIHQCRPGCAACCIAPSISSNLPALQGPKPAGMVCPHLDSNLLCSLFGHADRPKVCNNLQASTEMCGTCREQALETLSQWELATKPD